MTRWSIEDPQTLTFDAVHVLRLELVAGHVDVVTAETPRLEVTSVTGQPLSVTHEGVSLTIGYDDLPLGGVFGMEGAQTWGRFRDWEHHHAWGPGWGRSWGREGGKDDPWSWFSNIRRSVTLAVAVPEACQVQLAAVSAEAVVSGVSGQVRARGVSGDLTLDGLSGAVQVQTVSGDVTARSLRGEVDFVTASGEVVVASGESGDVRVKTVNGRVTIDLAPPPRGRIDVKTVSGGVTVRLPETADVDVDLTSMTGDVGGAFDGLARERKPGRATLSGRVGDGSGRLRAKTVSGDIALLRRPSAVTRGKESA